MCSHFTIRNKISFYSFAYVFLSNFLCIYDKIQNKSSYCMWTCYTGAYSLLKRPSSCSFLNKSLFPRFILFLGNLFSALHEKLFRFLFSFFERLPSGEKRVEHRNSKQKSVGVIDFILRGVTLLTSLVAGEQLQIFCRNWSVISSFLVNLLIF